MRHPDPDEYTDLYPAVLSVARRLVGPDAAEDVAQEAFLRLLSSPAPNAPDRWLRRVTRNLGIDEIRRRSRATPVEEVPDAGQAAPDVAELLAVREAVATLPERYRLVLWLKHAEGRTAREVAEILGTTQSSVELMLFRARRALRAAYEGKERGALGALLLPVKAAGQTLHGGLRSLAAGGAVAKAAAVVVLGTAIVPAGAPPAPPPASQAMIVEPSAVLPAPPTGQVTVPLELPVDADTDEVGSEERTLPIPDTLVDGGRDVIDTTTSAIEGASDIVLGTVERVRWTRDGTRVWIRVTETIRGDDRADELVDATVDARRRSVWRGMDAALVSSSDPDGRASLLRIERNGDLVLLDGTRLGLRLDDLRRSAR